MSTSFLFRLILTLAFILKMYVYAFIIFIFLQVRLQYGNSCRLVDQLDSCGHFFHICENNNNKDMEWDYQKGGVSPVIQKSGLRGGVFPVIQRRSEQRGRASPILSLIWCLVFLHCFTHTGAQFAKSSCKKCLSMLFLVKLFVSLLCTSLQQKCAKKALVTCALRRFRSGFSVIALV